MLFYKRDLISKAFEIITTYYKSVSIDFSSVLNGLKSMLNELKSMSIHSNLSSSQNQNYLKKKFKITILKHNYCYFSSLPYHRNPSFYVLYLWRTYGSKVVHRCYWMAYRPKCREYKPIVCQTLYQRLCSKAFERKIFVNTEHEFI
jgi:hypothetical protein